MRNQALAPLTRDGSLDDPRLDLLIQVLHLWPPVAFWGNLLVRSTSYITRTCRESLRAPDVMLALPCPR